MRTEELADALRDTAVVSAPDLARITGHGRRLAARRRVGAGLVALSTAAVVSLPFLVLGGGADRDTAQVQAPPRHDFSPAAPLGAVLETESKFYFGTDPHSASLGLEAVWAEAGNVPGQLTFGFRREGTPEVLRAGTMVVPDLAVKAVDLPAMPGQHDEPTYVGLFKMPKGVSADRYSVAVEEENGKDQFIEVRQEGSVLPGYLVFTVSATAELDRATYLVSNGRSRVVAEGGFAPLTESPE